MIALDLESIPRADLQDTHWPEYKAKKGLASDDDASLYPEFAQVCAVACINLDSSLAVVGEPIVLTAANFDEEKALLEALAKILDSDRVLAGHNIKGFDIPFLACRFLAHALSVPRALCLMGMKPWEIPHVDTMDEFKFGAGPMKSLESCCLILGIPSPKGPIRGSTVADAVRAGKLPEVGQYALRDASAVVRIIRKLSTLTQG